MGDVLALRLLISGADEGGSAVLALGRATLPASTKETERGDRTPGI
jgi:hypothetical protein